MSKCKSFSIQCIFPVIVTASILITGVFFSGCMNSDVTKTNEGFILKSWKTSEYSSYQISLNVEFDTNWSGRMDLYSPSGYLLQQLYFSNSTHNLSFLIRQTKETKPEFGRYQLRVTKIISSELTSVVTKDLTLVDANFTIIQCIPHWEFYEYGGFYILKTVNFTLENNGDFFGFIYEGRIIVDNGSVFLAPDYHWHDLNLWIKPGGNISIELPVEVPLRPVKNHFIKIYLQDKQLVTRAYYESSISLPALP